MLLFYALHHVPFPARPPAASQTPRGRPCPPGPLAGPGTIGVGPRPPWAVRTRPWWQKRVPGTASGRLPGDRPAAQGVPCHRWHRSAHFPGGLGKWTASRPPRGNATRKPSGLPRCPLNPSTPSRAFLQTSRKMRGRKAQGVLAAWRRSTRATNLVFGVFPDKIHLSRTAVSPGPPPGAD
jgi:hypothetical protein